MRRIHPEAFLFFNPLGFFAMKYLVPLVVVLALLGCDNNPGGSVDSANKTHEIGTSYLDKPLMGRINQRGLYRLVRSGGVVDDSKTSTGKIIAKPVIQLVKSTERIPLIKGAQMYLQYRIKPFPDHPAYVDFRQVLKHPEMTLPDGSVSTGSDIPFKGKVSANQSIGYIGYGFDEEYELVEGDWVFEVWYQDKKLVEQKFTTYWPNKEETATLESRLSPPRNKGGQYRTSTTPLAEKNWPLEITYDVADDPVLQDAVPLSEPPATTD